MRCPSCNSSETTRRDTPRGPHFAELRCRDCGRHLKWLPKPGERRRRRPGAHRDLVQKYSRGFCEMCLTKEEDLPAGQGLEAHHVVEYHDGGSGDRQNVWIVCTKCQKLIHWVRHWTSAASSATSSAVCKPAPRRSPAAG